MITNEIKAQVEYVLMKRRMRVADLEAESVLADWAETMGLHGLAEGLRSNKHAWHSAASLARLIDGAWMEINSSLKIGEFVRIEDKSLPFLNGQIGWIDGIGEESNSPTYQIKFTIEGDTLTFDRNQLVPCKPTAIDQRIRRA